ncbi:MAG TPA: bacillithiol biosynthesis cysteine-adding enzyme BshC [Phnomibacter sp.]|nr:bacillithiol biosynthesis cysteine-adding enzyme BshC [Phnomibacter sp.]
MNTMSTSVSYSETNAFSKLVLDYLKQAETLQPFYQWTPDFEGITKAIDAKAAHPVDRQLLVEQLRKQYAGYALTPKQEANLDALLQPNSYTITTAHQPNIFTGPLYFIYKIVHAIKLANSLNEMLPDNKLVPVYYMGSEDADLDELGHFYVQGEKRSWQTTQTGAVGRMHTKGLEQLTQQLEGQFAHLPFGPQMIALCRKAYEQHSNVQEATLYLVNELFKEYGLLVVIPDNAALKKVFTPIIKKELLGNFSQPEVDKTAALLSPHYKVQVKGRPINLFYLSESGQRERIEQVNGKWVVEALGLSFNESEILQLAEDRPELFSANVILRGLFQETILPNIVFIGGGGELAYWLELKGVFEKANVPYPVLMLRNSMLLLTERQQQLQQKNGLNDTELFLPLQSLLDKMAQAQHGELLARAKEEQHIFEQYERLQLAADKIDITLKAYLAALHAQALKGLHSFEKKLQRSARKKLGDSGRQLTTLHEQVFPAGNLQERIENFLPFYALFGPALIQEIYEHSPALQTDAFTIVQLPSKAEA